VALDFTRVAPLIRGAWQFWRTLCGLGHSGLPIQKDLCRKAIQAQYVTCDGNGWLRLQAGRRRGGELLSAVNVGAVVNPQDRYRRRVVVNTAQHAVGPTTGAEHAGELPTKRLADASRSTRQIAERELHDG